MEENKKSNNKLIIISLAVLLLGVLAYTFYTNSEHKKLTDAIEVEKLEIEQNLDSMIVRYEDAIAEKYDIPVIEDSAEAIGSSVNKRKCGTFGDFSILSFNGNKIIDKSFWK